MTDKEQQTIKYRSVVEKYSNKKLQKEIVSYRKYFQSHDSYYHWTTLNPNDFSNADIFLILREELNKRGLKENDR